VVRIAIKPWRKEKNLRARAFSLTAATIPNTRPEIENTVKKKDFTMFD
jgi:hypothetical protein